MQSRLASSATCNELRPLLAQHCRTATLAPADQVRQGAHNAEGLAASIPGGSNVRLHGRLDSGWKLDGLPLTVDGGTRPDKMPRVGGYVQDRGRVDETGKVWAERIRRR